ncbi:hypothetical protein EB72_12775, partial [Mycobacterium sp. SWH-M1]
MGGRASAGPLAPHLAYRRQSESDDPVLEPAFDDRELDEPESEPEVPAFPRVSLPRPPEPPRPSGEPPLPPSPPVPVPSALDPEPPSPPR